MTYIMQNSYGYSFSGLKSYLGNRMLRLYPSYWVILAISILIVLFWGEEQSKLYRSFIYIPNGTLEWLQNITLFYVDLFPSYVTPRLSPPTWALTVELLFYVLVGLGLSKSKWTSVVWFLFSSAFMIYTHIAELGYHYKYSFIFAGTLPFSIGAVVYHYRERFCNTFQSLEQPSNIAALFSLFVINSLVGAVSEKYDLHTSVFYISFYVNYLINTVLTPPSSP